jgi:hypothetical protein
VEDALFHVTQFRGFEKHRGRPAGHTRCPRSPRASAASARSATSMASAKAVRRSCWRSRFRRRPARTAAADDEPGRSSSKAERAELLPPVFSPDLLLRLGQPTRLKRNVIGLIKHHPARCDHGRRRCCGSSARRSSSASAARSIHPGLAGHPRRRESSPLTEERSRPDPGRLCRTPLEPYDADHRVVQDHRSMGYPKEIETSANFPTMTSARPGHGPCRRDGQRRSRRWSSEASSTPRARSVAEVRISPVRTATTTSVRRSKRTGIPQEPRSTSRMGYPDGIYRVGSAGAS